MNNVIREMPGFLPMINGVAFEPLGSFSISHPVAADLAEQFLAIEGFRLADADEIPAHLVAKVQAPAAQPATVAEPVLTGTLAGVQDADGKTRALSEMRKDELLAIAKDMEIDGCASMTKPQLVAAIEAEKVEIPADQAGEQAGETGGEQDGEEGGEDAENAADAEAGADAGTGEQGGAGAEAGDEQFF